MLPVLLVPAALAMQPALIANPLAEAVAPLATATPWEDGAVYRLSSAPGQLSTINLEKGEQLVSVAAGDTSRWVIGNTTSGSGDSIQGHVLVKPVAPGLRTNLVITTDRRVYQVLVESKPRAPVSSLGWTYGAPALLSIRPVDAPPRCCGALDLEGLDFGYRVEGDDPPWRPLRAFSYGHRTFIQFPRGIRQAEAPPLFLKGADGGLELVNYRMDGNYYVVDRLFPAAELRLGEKRQQKVTIVHVGDRPRGKAGKGS